MCFSTQMEIVASSTLKGLHSIAPAGATRLAQLNFTSAMAEQNCSICLDKLNICNKEGRLVLLYCGHIYHRKCIEEWMKSAILELQTCPTCPTCRRPCRYSRCDIKCDVK